MSGLETLMSPIRIGSMHVRNRIAMAPMSTDFALEDGSVSDRLLSYYAARAAGGAGLVIAEVVGVDAAFPYMPRTLGLWSDDLVPSMRRLADAVHERGACLVPQVSHPGPESLCTLFTGGEAVGPSPGILNSLTGLPCREITPEEIATVVRQYGEASRRARDAGCDGIELHAAHGYMLVGSFLSGIRNRRTDGYGGSLEQRLRFLREVLASIREHAGDDFPVVLRISGADHVPGGRTLEETCRIVPLLENAGVTAFHVSSGVYPDVSWRVIPPSGSPPCVNAPESRAVRQAASVPVLVVGRIGDPVLADELLSRGDADMVAMGRALLADPDLPNKAAEGRLDDIVPCVGCGVGCVAARERGSDMTCVVNPACGLEDECAIVPAQEPRKVMVCGGGPAGLEASRVAALRGHHVDLYERSHRLGGQYNLASAAPSKAELSKVIDHYARQIEKAGVQVHLQTAVTADLVREKAPDVVVVATGARPAYRDGTISAHDVLSGTALAGPSTALVVGGGMTGCDTAELLASRGLKVTLVEMQDEIAAGMFTEARKVLMHLFEEKQVTVLTDATVKELLPDGALVERQGREDEIRGMDTVILATGTEPVNDLAEALRSVVDEVHVIGDASEPRQALDAIAEGAEVGRRI